MNLSRWILVIGLMVGVGCLRVAQRNAIYLKGYAVGERMGRVHETQRDVSWLTADVIGLESPSRLARVAEERQLKLVAWSTLAPSFGLGKPASPAVTARAAGGGQPGESPVNIASADLTD